MIGHNRGPTLQAGAGFRKVAWQKARENLLPTLPLEVVRLRVKRAERLGLPYKTYATIRAVSGRDIVGFLFSDNAMGMGRGIDLPEVAEKRLAQLTGNAISLAALHFPKNPAAFRPRAAFAAVGRAPGLSANWRTTRNMLQDLARNGSVPVDGLVVVAATALEREWAEIAGLGGTIRHEVVFGTPT